VKRIIRGADVPVNLNTLLSLVQFGKDDEPSLANDIVRYKGELYSKRIDEMIAVLKTKGVPVLWVGLPAISGANATGEMSYLDGLYRARAEKAGITYVNIWDGFVDD
jgi:hypothetical protein